MTLILFFLGAFMTGSIPNAYLAGRLLKKIDIREHGSGNVGATNVFRVLGRGPGLAVFFLDFIKGALPVLAYLAAFSQFEPHRDLMALLVGLFAVLGHMFTPFLGFKGGKGVATGSGVICATLPILFLVTLTVWLVTFFLSRIVSLSSILAVFALFIGGLITPPHSQEVRLVLLGMFILLLWSHRSNIKKLIEGREHRWS